MFSVSKNYVFARRAKPDVAIPTTISPQAMRSMTAAGGSWRGAVADWSRDDTTFLTV